MRIKLLTLLWLYSIFTIAQTSMFDGNDKNITEYTPGNLPSIISVPYDGSIANNKIQKGFNFIEVISIEVFPNPVKTTIRFTSNVSISQLIVYNILGQKVSTHIINKSNGAINIEDLVNGIYLVKFEINDKDFSITKRILKN